MSISRQGDEHTTTLIRAASCNRKTVLVIRVDCICNTQGLFGVHVIETTTNITQMGQQTTKQNTFVSISVLVQRCPCELMQKA